MDNLTNNNDNNNSQNTSKALKSIPENTSHISRMYDVIYLDSNNYPNLLYIRLLLTSGSNYLICTKGNFK